MVARSVNQDSNQRVLVGVPRDVNIHISRILRMGGSGSLSV